MAGTLVAGASLVVRSLRVWPLRASGRPTPLAPSSGSSGSGSSGSSGLSSSVGGAGGLGMGMGLGMNGRAAEEGVSGLDFSASTGWFRPDKYY
jgi:hypothetical protein